MKRFLILLVGLGLWSSAGATELIVASSGTSFWVKQSRVEQGQLVYTLENGTAEERVDRTTVEAIIPVAERGRNYPAERVAQVIAQIDAVQSRHSGLRKQLNLLRQEWSQLQQADTGLEREIDALIARFDKTPWDTVVYKEVVLALGMLQFKDMRGTYATRIESAVKDMQARYCQTNLVRLAGFTNQPVLSIGAFKSADQLARELKAIRLGEPEKQKVDRLLAICRTNTWTANGRRAWDGFAAARTIGAYLDSAAIYSDLKRFVAVDDQQRELLDTQIRRMQGVLGKSAPEYSFQHKGYPLHTRDHAVLARTGKRAALTRITSIELDEQCFVFPLEVAPAASLHQPVSMSVRVVFNRTPPPDRKFCMTGMLFGMKAMNAVRRSAPMSLALKDGHADLVFKVDFSDLSGDFEVERQDNGGIVVFGYLEYCDGIPGTGQAERTAASLAFPIPVHE